MSELILSGDAWVVPSCKGKPHCLDMRRIYKAESRIFELGSVTREKAGELIHCFVEAYGEARRYRATLKAEHDLCKHRLKQLRGMIVLDKAPDALKQRQLVSSRSPAGSEDLRDAVVYTDVDYGNAVERLAQVEAAHEEMDAKVEKLKMAYFSVGALIEGAQPVSKISGGVDDKPDFKYEIEKFVDDNIQNPDTYVEGFGSVKF